MFALAIAAAQTPSAAPASKRPRVGLVLSGGGARGGAHVGVLKVLEQLRIPIDCIAGTSMGALIGGGYASGMSASEIEQFIRGVDWRAVVGNVGARALEPIEQKRFNAPGAIELGIRRGRVIFPDGLIETSRIEDVLRTYVARTRSVADFDKLPIPFRAVATDMLSGNMVVLDHGDIATAMRASMAIPGIFSPVITDQYVLSDGFVVRNLPIDVARATCADVVIAVNIVKPVATRQQLTGIAGLIARSYDVMSEANERLQLQTLGERDVRVDVAIHDISPGSFERTADTIAFGEEAALAVRERLSALSVSPADYAAWRQRVSLQRPIEARILEIRFEGLKHINPEYLRTLTQVRAGDRVDIAAISRDADRMAALDDIEGVEYRLSGDPTNPVLIWQPAEKSTGPNYLRPSGGLYDAGGGDLRFEVDVQYVRRWLNAYGGQWRSQLQIGSTSLVGTSLYQPLQVAQTVFVEPEVQFSRSLEYLYNDYERIAQYRFLDLRGQLDLGVNLSNSAQIRAGYWHDRRHTTLDTGVLQLPTGAATDAGIETVAFYDTREASSFPSSGRAAELQYISSNADLGGSRDWERIEGAERETLRVKKVTLWLTAAGGTQLGSSLPADRAFSLGGPQSFPGYAPGEVRARTYWTASGDVLWRIADVIPVANQSIYSGFSLQAGRVQERVDPVPDGELYGASIFAGGRTPIGTLSVGLGIATGTWGIWITFGKPVGSGSILDEPLFR